MADYTLLAESGSYLITGSDIVLSPVILDRDGTFDRHGVDYILPDTQTVNDGLMVGCGYLTQASPPTVSLQNTTDDVFSGEGIGKIAVDTSPITLSTAGECALFVNSKTDKTWIRIK